jgi:hypothetical protein
MGEDGGDIVDGAPLVLENVQADGAIGVGWKRGKEGGGSKVREGWGEQRLDRGQDGGDIVDGAPLVLENVQADGAIGVD